MDAVTKAGVVVIAGEALVDLVPGPGDTLRAHPGGGPFNAARAAARLGAPVAFLGRLSSDRLGRALRDALDADGVALEAAVATDDPTTLAIAEVDAAGAATYRFYADGTSAPGLRDARMPPGASMLCVGTLGLVFEPAAAALERLVAAAPADVLVAVDPNCRPAAIVDVAAYRARLARILARADLVKASAEDLAWLAPGRPPAEALRALLAPGAAGVATLGEGGALVVAPGGGAPVAIPAPRVAVVDTIGAGDAFLGALLAWWHRAGHGRGGLADAGALAEAARYAVAVAAATCTRAGADPPRAGDALP